MRLNVYKTIFFFAFFFAIAFWVNAQTRTDFLTPQLTPANDSLTCKYIRHVTQLNDSSYQVVVRYKSGELMMSGAYADKYLAIENGNFKFFYANGLVESEGKYQNGAKVGIWKRWNYDGREKPDRFYPDENFKRSNRTTAAAKFPSGMSALHKLVDDSLVYPPEAMNRKIQGTVYITFLIDEAGDVRQAEVSEGVHYLLDEEALRFVSNMPIWTPAMRYGIPIDSSFIMPITFDIKTESVSYEKSSEERSSKPKTSPIAAQR